jgi:L-serine/L-threonine ammonia-lyase
MQETLHHQTPIIHSTPLSKKIGIDVFVKLESTQQTGSFKIRGIGNMCTKAVKERGCKHLISSSGGNAGLAVAYSAKRLGVPATIYVPVTTADFMREKNGNGRS